MLRIDMFIQHRLRTELLRTQITHIRLLMRLHMPPQSTMMIKPHLAHLATVHLLFLRLLPSVHSLMDLQIARIRVRFRTRPASVRLVPGMDPHVAIQSIRAHKPLPALVAQKRALVRVVRLNMQLQVVRLAERLPAIVATKRETPRM